MTARPPSFHPVLPAGLHRDLPAIAITEALDERLGTSERPLIAPGKARKTKAAPDDPGPE